MDKGSGDSASVSPLANRVSSCHKGNVKMKMNQKSLQYKMLQRVENTTAKMGGNLVEQRQEVPPRSRKKMKRVRT